MTMTSAELELQARAVIRMGQKVLDTETTDHRRQSQVEETVFHDFRISGLSFLSRVFTEQSDYYQSFKSEVTHPTPSRTRRGIGILEAAGHALAEGWLETARTNLAKTILLDMLSFAKAEADDKRFAAAITMTCMVLEKHLRDLAKTRGLNTENKTREGLVPKRGMQLTSELYKKKVLNRQQNKTLLKQFELLKPNEDGTRRKFGPKEVFGCIDTARKIIGSE